MCYFIGILTTVFMNIVLFITFKYRGNKKHRKEGKDSDFVYGKSGFPIRRWMKGTNLDQY